MMRSHTRAILAAISVASVSAMDHTAWHGNEKMHNDEAESRKRRFYDRDERDEIDTQQEGANSGSKIMRREWGSDTESELNASGQSSSSVPSCSRGIPGNHPVYYLPDGRSASEGAELFQAIDNNDISRVMSILRRKPCLIECCAYHNGGQETPLYRAINKNMMNVWQMWVANYLIDSGARVSRSVYDGEHKMELMPIVKAIYLGHRNLVHSLIAAGATCEHANREQSPFALALHNGDISYIEHMLQYRSLSSRDNLQNILEHIEAGYDDMFPLLFKSVAGDARHIHFLKRILKKAYKDERFTYFLRNSFSEAVCEAASHGHFDAVCMILTYAPSQSRRLDGFMIAINEMIRSGYSDTANRLLDTCDYYVYARRSSQEYVESPVWVAALCGQDDTLQRLLSRSTECEIINRKRYDKSLLHAAVESDNISTVRLCIQAGAEMNKRHRGKRMADQSYRKGSTALHYAVLHDNIEVVRLLLQNGADSRVVGKTYTRAENASCLHLAKSRHMIILLMQYGARTDDLFLPDRRKPAPETYWYKKDLKKIVQLREWLDGVSVGEIDPLDLDAGLYKMFEDPINCVCFALGQGYMHVAERIIHSEHMDDRARARIMLHAITVQEVAGWDMSQIIRSITNRHDKQDIISAMLDITLQRVNESELAARVLQYLVQYYFNDIRCYRDNDYNTYMHYLACKPHLLYKLNHLSQGYVLAQFASCYNAKHIRPYAFAYKYGDSGLGRLLCGYGGLSTKGVPPEVIASWIYPYYNVDSAYLEDA